ncbi:MAG: ADP-forming succinate--CoA ligase subunit beta [candidate division NC10 bacterium]|nr:ADP-forming succinate--CoA ligase subunit beta [candidate division NC10 bacterium]
MKIHEYQAKKILREHGIPIPNGGIAGTPAEAKELAFRLGGKAVVKVQIHAGGRGKAGGVRMVASPKEAEQAAFDLLGRSLVTPQTSPEGARVNTVLVEERVSVASELYVGTVVDRHAALPVIMASEAGGMEIEEVAAHFPEKILKVRVDPASGFQPFHARKLAYGLRLPAHLITPASELIRNLYKVFEAKDCSLAEINPLVVTEDGRLLALDAKLTFDDNALFRHPELQALRDPDQELSLEVEASKYGLNYIKLGGDVGCMVNGAGLAMATMDIVKLHGGEPANFLDVGGGASAEQIENAFRILISDQAVRAVFINIFGGILRCDRLAEGIIQAVKKLDVKVPVIIRMEGTNVEQGRRMLQESGLNFITASDMADGARRSVEAARAFRGMVHG